MNRETHAKILITQAKLIEDGVKVIASFDLDHEKFPLNLPLRVVAWFCHNFRWPFGRIG